MNFKPTFTATRLAAGLGMLLYLALLTREDFLFHGFSDGWRDYAQLASYVVIIPASYLNYQVLAPKLLLPRHYGMYLLVVAGILLLILVPDLFSPPPPPPSGGGGGFPQSPGFPQPDGGGKMHLPVVHITNKLFFYAAGLFASSFLRINERWQQTEKDRLRAELFALKAQINPHFLFNTLNNIYACALKEDAPVTASAMLKLSGMMRYVMTETPGLLVPLRKELTHIEDYLSLQRLRLGAATELHYTVQVTDPERQLAPMLLIPFIENAFKYGVNPDVPSGIFITLTATTTQLQLMVRNAKVAGAAVVESTGYGLANTRRRIESMYPGTHLLTITEDDRFYEVSLTLPLQ